ncbi:MAG: hypothetical protein LAQ69_02150 [Acidobacteriia bacterium]|nr:hypothetical protein [Terriglobia bacterium]
MLYEYDRWANNRVLRALSALSPEQFTRDLGGSFRSVRDTLVHIIGGEWGWLVYWKEPSYSPTFLTDLWTRHDALFNPDAFPNLTAVQLRWAEVEIKQNLAGYFTQPAEVTSSADYSQKSRLVKPSTGN